MQRLQSLFRRSPAARAVAVPAGKPTPLSLESLKLVAGGLPRVSSVPVSSNFVEPPLPRVS